MTADIEPGTYGRSPPRRPAQVVPIDATDITPQVLALLNAKAQINWAVTKAGKLDETTIMHTLQHLNINTLGIVWNRTPDNYENISQVDAAMETIGPNGAPALFKAPGP